jgi:hypothetical protein
VGKKLFNTTFLIDSLKNEEKRKKEDEEVG